MPDLSRFIIKLSLAYLAGALLIGLALAAPGQLEQVFGPLLAALRPAYVHLLVVGWLTQLIFGVAYWLFPRHSRETPYGRSWLAVTGFILLNAGLILRLVCEPALSWSPSAVWQWGLGASALSQWLGVVGLTSYFWGRVKRK